MEEIAEDPDVRTSLTEHDDTAVKTPKARVKPRMHTSMSVEEEVCHVYVRSLAFGTSCTSTCAGFSPQVQVFGLVRRRTECVKTEGK